MREAGTQAEELHHVRRHGRRSLLHKAVAGDGEALETLLLQHFDRLVADISHRIPDDVRSALSGEDVVQDAFIVAFQRIGTFEPRSSEAFFAWLSRIAENRLMDAVKALRAAKRGGGWARVTDAGDADADDIIPLLEMLHHHSRTPSRSAAAREAAAALAAALDSLDPDYREVLRLRYAVGPGARGAAGADGQYIAVFHGIGVIANSAPRRPQERAVHCDIDTGKYFVLFVAFSADGKRLFTHQRCWDIATGRQLARLSARDGWEANSWLLPDQSFEWATNGPRETTNALLHDGKPLVHTTDAFLFRPVASPDARRFAIALQRGAIQFFDANDREVMREIPIDPASLTGAAFSHDGEGLITWTNAGRWTIWDVASGREKLTRSHGSAQLVNAALSPDDRLLATASYDGAARIWDAGAGNELHVLRPTGAPAGDQSVVWSVAFSPDGTRLATGSKDRRIRLWDVATGQELIALARHAGTVMCLAWSPDGTQLASGGFEGTVCLWDSLSRAERSARVESPDDQYMPNAVSPRSASE